jgi:hypothetical protein
MEPAKFLTYPLEKLNNFFLSKLSRGQLPLRFHTSLDLYGGYNNLISRLLLYNYNVDEN